MKKQNNILDFELLYDYILIDPIDTESVDGLTRPNKDDDKPEYGKVLAVGEGRLLDDGTIIPPKIKKGDIIFFGKFSSSNVHSDGKTYFLIRDDDVMAVKKNEKH